MKTIRENKLVLLAVLLVVIGLSFILQNATAEDYIAEPVIVLTAEQKLTQNLNNLMVEQTAARALRVRAELAFIEAQELENKADSEVVNALEGIILYQGL